MRTTLTVVLLSAGTLSAHAQDGFGGQPAPAAQPPASGYPAGASPYGPAPSAAAPVGSPDLDRLMVVERQDFGVAPTDELHAGPMHAPTPASIPGGQLITTKGLVPLLANTQVKALVFDILGGPEMLPGAIPAVPASQPGSFSDRNQTDFGNYLQQLTQGNKQAPLVFYCLSSHCWMSYNASLRAIHLGYQNVLWYRGGIEAWKAAGQPVQPAGGGRTP